MSTTTSPATLRAEIERSGYYPALVGEAVELALGAEPVLGHVVHLETTFDAEEIRRHVTVLVLTPSRLVVSHTDEHAPEAGSPGAASTSTEAVALSTVRSVVVTRVVEDPARHRPGTPPAEAVLTVGWGAVSRVDLEPASCSDPACEADHGYSGAITVDDVSLRVSSAAEGADAVAGLLGFASALSAATGR